MDHDLEILKLNYMVNCLEKRIKKLEKRMCKLQSQHEKKKSFFKKRKKLISHIDTNSVDLADEMHYI